MVPMHVMLMEPGRQGGLTGVASHLLTRGAASVMRVRRGTDWLATRFSAVQGWGQDSTGCRCCSMPAKALQGRPGRAGCSVHCVRWCGYLHQHA